MRYDNFECFQATIHNCFQLYIPVLQKVNICNCSLKQLLIATWTATMYENNDKFFDKTENVHISDISLVPLFFFFFVRARGEPGNEATYSQWQKYELKILSIVWSKLISIIFEYLSTKGICDHTIVDSMYIKCTFCWQYVHKMYFLLTRCP